MRARLPLPAFWAALLLAGQSAAQTGEAPGGPVPDLIVEAPEGPPVLSTPLLVIDPELLFRDSAFGQASAARIEAERGALGAENRELEAALEAEERDLTARRATLPAEEFRALAAAFDARAEGVRSEQAAKDRTITDSRQTDRQQFLQAAAPVLARMMAEMDAVVILDKQVVFVSFEAIDVTARAIARIDAALGNGSAAETPPIETPALQTPTMRTPEPQTPTSPPQTPEAESPAPAP